MNKEQEDRNYSSWVLEPKPRVIAPADYSKLWFYCTNLNCRAVNYDTNNEECSLCGCINKEAKPRVSE